MHQFPIYRQLELTRDHDMYNITDSEEDVNPYNSTKRPKIAGGSDDLCQRISNLMKKTRMNSFQRKNLTTTSSEKDWNALSDEPISSRDNVNAGFTTAKFNKEPNVQHLSFRSSENNRRIENPVKQNTEAFTYSKESLLPRVNTFMKKSMSTQEYIPGGTSGDLSRVISNIGKENCYSPDVHGSNMRLSMNADFNPINSFGNQSNTFTMQPAAISKHKIKHKFYKNK
jgi:hypothetical protein